MTLLDNRLFERIAALATCLCGEIADPANGVPGVCFCGLVPGNAIPAEYSGDCNSVCGAAWVRLVSFYPSNSVGIATTDPGNCKHGLGADVEVGIVRCLPVGDAQGNPPTPEDLLEAAQLQVADALLMMKAIECCDAIPAIDVIVGQYQPIGPEGGIVGGAYVVSLGV